MSFEAPNPFLYQLREGSIADPYVDKVEILKPVSGRVVLSELPVKQNGILVEDHVEIDSNAPIGGQFYVDYTYGVIYFERNKTASVTVRYKGRGVVLLPSDRIFYKSNDVYDNLNAHMNSIDKNIDDYRLQLSIMKNSIDGIAHSIKEDFKSEIINSAKINWKSPVANFASLSINYPTPIVSDTVQTLDDGKIYRFDGTAWLFVQEFGQGAITAVKNDVDMYTDQIDFVNMIERSTEYEKMMFKRENSLNWITVMLLRGNEHISWTFRNNTYDEYWILGDCFSGAVSSALAMYSNTNYGSITGTWATTAPNAHYATSVGATMTTTVVGESIEFHHYGDNRGGIWEFVIDGDTANKITVSTYRSTANPTNSITLKSGLPFGTHTVVGTFKGDDPANIPSTGAGTSRGWVYVDGANSYLTFRGFKTQINNSRVKDLFVNFSNKEFALKMRKLNTGTAQFVPMHSNIGTAFNAEPKKVVVDGATVDPSTMTIGEFVACNDFKLSQRIYARNPDSGAENLATIATTVSINKKGTAEINGKMEVLSTIQVEEGYFLMAPVSKPMISRLATSINQYYAMTKTDGTKTFLINEKDRATSYAFTSSTEKDYVIGVRFNDYRNTLRTDKPSKYTPSLNTWTEHRDNSLTKLYVSVFKDAILKPGEVYKWSGSLVASKIANIHDLI